VIVFGEHIGCLPFRDLLKPAAAVQPAEIEPASTVALIPFSSGTTGLPKGVLLTHRNIVSELAALRYTVLYI
jgi:long-subunit acyl-CoA synthetase (AMP-forming)